MRREHILWGGLAVEQYLIVCLRASTLELANTLKQRNWDSASPESPSEQRLRLIYGFLDLDEIPYEWFMDLHATSPSRQPTAEEIEIILQPWRPDALRKKAEWMHSGDGIPILLRTHYSSNLEDEETLKAWIDEDTFEEASDWACLNDEKLFNFGDDWRQIFEILPEVAGPTNSRQLRCIPHDHLELFRNNFKKHISTVKQNCPDDWKERESRYEIILDWASSLHRVITEVYLLIADEEAFQTKQLRLLYLDGKRNIVREARVDPDVWQMYDIIMQHYTVPTEPYEFSTVGEKYRVDGELGKELYQLSEEDLGPDGGVAH